MSCEFTGEGYNLVAMLAQGAVAPGVYRCEANIWPDELGAAATLHGWRFYYLAGATIFDKRSFLGACQAALNLPAYFGYNWDAFEETMRDLAWAPASGYLVLYDHVANFAANRPAEWAIALDILRGAAGEWARLGTPFYVLLRHNGRATAGVPLLRP